MTILDTLCIELTARCPLRCVHCSANAAPERNDFLPYKALASTLPDLGSLSETYLSGGEPFEHPNLLRIIQTARRISRPGCRVFLRYLSCLWQRRSAPLPFARRSTSAWPPQTRSEHL